ncbi:MAG: phosphohistidine phosphatase SixA [Thalassotalea sp.]|nr:phosphohistidine phosphatase SixA [Thalassotalea sp.]MDG2392617.1 phosphohistidine phosphatase SixA [Thalassotalea sp.]
MNLFIMRHGDAVLQASSDAQRELSELGILEAKVMAKWLKIENQAIDLILVSPYIRAQQTAKALLDELQVEIALETISFITPEGNAKDVHDYIDGLLASSSYQNILIVSHMPLVCYLTAELTAESHCPLFQTASIAKIEYDTQMMSGSLTKMVSPDDFAR